jgi:hypothetical protein
MEGTMKTSANEKVAKKILDLIDYWELGEEEIGRYLARLAPNAIWEKLMNMFDYAILERNEQEGVPSLDDISGQQDKDFI